MTRLSDTIEARSMGALVGPQPSIWLVALAGPQPLIWLVTRSSYSNHVLITMQSRCNHDAITFGSGSERRGSPPSS